MSFFSGILHFIVTSDGHGKDTAFPFSTYAICAICVDSGKKVRKIHEIFLRNISEG